MGKQYRCPFRDGKPYCDNRVAKKEMKTERLNAGKPSYQVCVTCLEGIRTRAYIKKIIVSA